MDLTDLFESLSDCVVADDLESFHLQLEALPLNAMTSDEIEQFYAPLLNLVAEYRRDRFVAAIEERDRLWFFEDVEVPDFPFFILLFLNVGVTVSTLRWLGTHVYSDFSVVEVIDMIRNHDDGPRLKIAGLRVLETFPVEIPQLRVLVEVVGDQSSHLREALVEILVDRLRDTTDPHQYAAVPSWVIDGNYVPLEEIGALIEEEKTRLEQQVKKMNPREIIPKDVDLGPLDEATRRDLAYWFLLQRSEVIFQLLGPPNPIREDVHLTAIGCRLFNCDLFEEEEWFDGVCDNCLFKIRVPQHCVRLPLIGGGWRNSYCSWRCAIEDLITLPDYDDDVKVGMIQMIKYFMGQLYDIGVLETEDGGGGRLNLHELRAEDLDAITRRFFNRVIIE